jgi:hypothetical protein
MSRIRTELTTLAYFIVGGIGGGIAGIGVAWGAMVYSIHANPSDPSAGSVGIIVMLTFPVGAFAGCCIALVLRQRRLRQRQTNHGFEVMTKTGAQKQGRDSI